MAIKLVGAKTYVLGGSLGNVVCNQGQPVTKFSQEEEEYIKGLRHPITRRFLFVDAEVSDVEAERISDLDAAMGSADDGQVEGEIDTAMKQRKTINIGKKAAKPAAEDGGEKVAV